MKTVSGKPDPTYVLRFGRILESEKDWAETNRYLSVVRIDRRERILEETQPIFRSIRVRALVC
jgi:hypothetical protein